VYNKISLDLLQSSRFQIQYNAISAKFIELYSCWRTYTTEQSQLQYRLYTVHWTTLYNRKNRTFEL